MRLLLIVLSVLLLSELIHIVIIVIMSLIVELNRVVFLGS